MNKTIRTLLLSAMMLLSAGWFLYHRGSQLNFAVTTEETLWDQAPGDKWLYVGGLMMLMSGSLTVAAVKVWRGNREQGTGNREQGTGNREQGTGNREQGTGNREQGTGNNRATE